MLIHTLRIEIRTRVACVVMFEMEVPLKELGKVLVLIDFPKKFLIAAALNKGVSCKLYECK
jgi:hypothetical protein